jgi:hypothetical protein
VAGRLSVAFLSWEKLVIIFDTSGVLLGNK